jgi:two-component system, NarL family, response regulator DegU
MVAELLPDVLLLDAELPDLPGVEVVRRIRAAGWPVKILVISAHSDDHYVQEMLASGVEGYLAKEEAPRQIVEAVLAVAQGAEGIYSRPVMARWMTSLRDEQVKLTRRERDVLRLLVEGKTNQGMAAALGISEKTVEKHLGSLYLKLNVTNRVDAAVMAVRLQLV